MRTCNDNGSSESLKEGNKARRRACGRACVHARAGVHVLPSRTCCLCIRACLYEHAGTRAWVRTYKSLRACKCACTCVLPAHLPVREKVCMLARLSAPTQACVPVCATARACLRACTYVLPARM